jgi:hypothetical protein
LFGRELEFVKRRRNYGDDLVYVYGVDGELFPLPAEWTDAVSADPFVEAAAGRAPFRTGDLLELPGRVARQVPDPRRWTLARVRDLVARKFRVQYTIPICPSKGGVGIFGVAVNCA